MNHRPEAGEEDARGFDSNRQRSRNAGDKVSVGSGDSFSPDVGPADVEIHHEDAPLILEDDHISEQNAEQNAETGSGHTDEMHKAQDAHPGLDISANMDEISSVLDDGPSLQGSVVSSTHSDSQPLRSPGSRNGSTTPRRPFDLRFQSRLSLSPLSSPRAKSPAFLNTHSRQSSLASIGTRGLPDLEAALTPWDVIRWTRLRKLTGQVFSEIGKRNFGRPTCLAVSTSIVIGTSKGLVLVFDYQQNIKGIIGSATKAVECGPVTSLAISEDSTTLAVGHAEGHIFTWELAHSTRPFLHIPPLELTPDLSRNSDGHLAAATIIHVGFLGFRHTALVSADDRGMAFSHLATRGMGSIGRAVRTTRVLGRYPDIIHRQQKARKPSSVLAFSTLPFGNVEQAMNTLGLVAMMTPYLLVIVSTTPVAQTQHKAARPKEIAAHSTMTAALTWFPAIKLKTDDAAVSRTKLAYCWSNVLTVLEVTEAEPSEAAEKEKPLELAFKARSRWRCEEAIVAVQWLSRSVMAILTITQQLIILEDVSMDATDSFDLVQKQIYHNDFFSQQLQALVEQLDEEDASMHGVVADAFYMSFRAYKGRLFVLGTNDISIGSLSNWADRLLAMLEAGDFIGAIRLATSYYSGNGEKVTIGLPEDDKARHTLVREKLLEMISASLKYAFGQNRHAGTGQLGDSQLRDLAIACVEATLKMQDGDFLFEEVFSWYEDHHKAFILLEVLEKYILDGQIVSMPPAALRPLIDHHMTTNSPASLEEIICCLDTSSMDIDQVTGLCKRYKLYDAYIYVWTEALGDYVGPIDELFKLSRGSSKPTGFPDEVQSQGIAMKVFPYLSFTLTSRVYPIGYEMDSQKSCKAQEQIYGFFFSGAQEQASVEPAGSESRQSFPNLRKLLLLDTASSMSVFNEAFEDTFLNKPDELTTDTDEYAPSDKILRTKSFTRQFVVTVLLEVTASASFVAEDSIYIDMFIARSLPKYPQDLVLSGSTLSQLLTRLCDFPNDDVAEDCQLSVEYLLSIYHPPDIQAFVPLFREARFFRVLKSVYRSENQWSLLVEIYFLDSQEQEGVFDVIRICFSNTSAPSSKQRQEILGLVQRHAGELANIDVHNAATLVADLFPDLHEAFLSALRDDPLLQYKYLNSLFEPQGHLAVRVASSPPLIERYIQLLCQHDPHHVADYVSSLKDVDLELGKILPFMEASGTIDAAVILMAHQGQVQGAMSRLVDYLGSLNAALSGILHNAEESPDMASTEETIHDLLGSIEKYSGVGVWLCQRQSKLAHQSRPVTQPSKRSAAVAQPLTFDESLWLQLIVSVVTIAKSFSPSTIHQKVDAHMVGNEGDKITFSLRAVVQNVFTALLKATTSPREGPTNRTDLSFLQILRAFLTQAAASSPSLAELRAVISSIFSAYAYEESLLALSNSMLDKDLFVHVDEIAKLRRRGWRPRGQVCEICRRRVWGPGAGAQIWEAWLEREEQKRVRKQTSALESEVGASVGKGKAIVENPPAAPSHPESSADLGGGGGGGDMSSGVPNLGPALIFACRHLFHATCLDAESNKAPGHKIRTDRPLQRGVHLERRCPICS